MIDASYADHFVAQSQQAAAANAGPAQVHASVAVDRYERRSGTHTDDDGAFNMC